ncbi:MAG: hypothetical protein IPL37_09850 [Austwickia sp.]|nr:hypothetical protein [Austwickia sp.]
MTITVDPDVLRRARIRALQRDESVNAYLAQVLREYADEAEQAEVFAVLDRLADEEGAGFAGRGRSWTRDELHRTSAG